MFIRIHSFKFQNEFAKESVKQKLKVTALEFFSQGLLTQSFVDVDKTNLYMINTWESEIASKKIYEKFKKNIFEQVKEMGVKLSILGGAGEVMFSDLELLNRFSNVKD